MLSTQPVLLPGASRCKPWLLAHKRPLVVAASARARKQSEKQHVEADLAPEPLPADFQELSKLAKAELQRHLEVRGLERNGNKEELANRLLDNLIAQESVVNTYLPNDAQPQQQQQPPAADAASTPAAARRGRRPSRKATASADPQPESYTPPGSPQGTDPIIAAAAATAAVAEPTEQVASSRRGRKTSRKATSSSDPLPTPADIVAAATAAAPVEVKPAGRARRTSRKGTTSSDPLTPPADVAAPAADEAAEPAAAAAAAESKTSRRGRKTSRKATSSADPLDASPAAAAAAAITTAEPAAAADTAAAATKGGRRSKSSVVEPAAAVAADSSSALPEASGPVAKAGRGLRASRKSSVAEAELAAGAQDASEAAAPVTTPTTSTRPRGGFGRRSSAKTASKKPEARPAAAAAAADMTTVSPPVSRAKLLAQQLAKKEIATHGAAAAAGAAAGAAAAAAGVHQEVSESQPAPAGLGSSWPAGDEMLAVGSQAQSDSLLMGSGDHGMQAVGAQSTFSIDNGSVDEVIAQLTAERAAGLADEPQLRPEAILNPPVSVIDSSSSAEQQLQEVPNMAASAAADSSDVMEGQVVLPPSAGAVDAAVSWASAATLDAAVQHPTMADCVAAVEEPLSSTAVTVEVDEAPDAAMAAFDHIAIDTAPVAGLQQEEEQEQHPTMADCVAAVEEPLSTAAAAVEVDEAPDAAMAAFDHTTLDTPAAAAVAGGNQSPSLVDIAYAVKPSALPASLSESAGEDEEPDTALAAFDHMVPEVPTADAAVEVPAATAVAAVPAVLASADEGPSYDQSFLDPLQPSALAASVGSGSVDLFDLEQPVAAVAAAAAAATVVAPAAPAAVELVAAAPAAVEPVAAASAAVEPVAAASAAVEPVAAEQQGSQEASDLGAMLQRWWASVMAVFEDWQKNLGGRK